MTCVSTFTVRYGFRYNPILREVKNWKNTNQFCVTINGKKCMFSNGWEKKPQDVSILLVQMCDSPQCPFTDTLRI